MRARDEGSAGGRRVELAMMRMRIDDGGEYDTTTMEAVPDQI